MDNDFQIVQRKMEEMGADGRLDLGRLRLQTLPPLPNGIVELYCNDNNLTSLPTLPSTLKKLVCVNNKLTTLPTLPNGLTHLHCGNNRLRTLPHLPETLQMFSCKSNLFEGYLKELLDPYSREWMRISLYPQRGLREPKEAILGRLTQEIVPRVNQLLDRQESIKEELIAARFDPRKIQANMNRNQVNMEGELSDANWDKYFTRRGEVWTHGVGQAYGPWKGGKTKRRKSKKSKTHKKRTYTNC